jgi:hypothetical protein
LSVFRLLAYPDMDVPRRHREGADNDVATVVLIDLQFVQVAIDDVEKEMDCRTKRIVGAIKVSTLHGNPLTDRCGRPNRPELKASRTVYSAARSAVCLDGQFISARKGAR